MDSISGNRLLAWWCNRDESSKNRFPPSHLRLIDWDVIGRICKRLSSTHRMRKFIPKWVTGEVPVGVTLTKRKERIINRCPRCDHYQETTLHVIRCKNSKSAAKWREQLSSLETWMKKQQTDPSLRTTLLDTLREWYLRPNTTVLPTCPPNFVHFSPIKLLSAGPNFSMDSLFATGQ